MKRIAVILLALIVAGCSQVQLSEEELCEKTWRYDLACALKHTLSGSEISKIKNLADKLRGENCAESAWNILAWVDENIQYDVQKASLPQPVIEVVGRDVKVVAGEARMYQTPAETVMLGRGICGDYAILTAALLLAADCSAYVLNVSFAGEEQNHVTAAVKLDQLYVLDQHLPPMDLGSYYRKWLRDGKTIERVEVYEVTPGKVAVVATMQRNDLERFDYAMTQADAENLERKIESMLHDSFGLKVDERLKGKTLPHDYVSGEIWRLTVQDYADYFTPAFADEIAEHFYDMLVEDLDLKNARAFNLEVAVQGDDVVLTLVVAR